MELEIPEALHLCPGCGDLACGSEYCESCRSIHRDLIASEPAASPDDDPLAGPRIVTIVLFAAFTFYSALAWHFVRPSVIRWWNQ
jgi:hypothetical protein